MTSITLVARSLGSCYNLLSLNVSRCTCQFLRTITLLHKVSVTHTVSCFWC